MARKPMKFTFSSAGKQPAMIIVHDKKPRNRVVAWIGRFFMLLGVMALISSISTMTMLANLGEPSVSDKEALKDGAILTYHFRGGLGEVQQKATLMSPLVGQDPTMHDVAWALREAADDPTVLAFIGRISEGPYNYAEVTELADAVKDFRASGKKAYAYALSFGDGGNGMLEYYLASAFDEIWMQPLGQISLTGFQAEVPYFKSVLDKIGVKPEIFQRKEFKTAPESALRDDMSAANKISLLGILNGFTKAFQDQVLGSGRKIDEAHLLAAIGNMPVADEDALAHGYIDHLAYVDELVDRLKEVHKIKKEAFRSLMNYDFTTQEEERKTLLERLNPFAEEEDKKDANAKTVAVIFIDGAIMPSDDNAMAMAGPFALLGSPNAGALEISSEIKHAADRPDIDAILLRINSPGGSPAASEVIRRSVVYAKQKGLKIVVSMGEAAASGGYWIAADADRILAYPTTLTGSIGVFGGKVALSELWDKLGINWETVALADKDNTLWTTNRPYGEREEVAVNRMMDSIYDGFKSRVAVGRNIDAAQVERIAKGRVWTGDAAVGIRLVDRLGTMEDAMDEVADLLQTDRDHLEDIILPEPPSPLEAFFSMLREGPSVMAGLHRASAAAQLGMDMVMGADPAPVRTAAALPLLRLLSPELLRAQNPVGYAVMMPSLGVIH